MIWNEDTRFILGSVVFMLFLVVCVVIAVLGQRWYDHEDKRRRALESRRRKMELLRKKEQEAADFDLLDKIEEYRHDFDGYSGAS